MLSLARISDFDPAALAERKRAVERAVAAAQARHPRARITCQIEDRCGNIDAAIDADCRCVNSILSVFEALGIAAKVVTMQGGTDGPELSARPADAECVQGAA